MVEPGYLEYGNEVVNEFSGCDFNEKVIATVLDTNVRKL
jgi:hypothetical protein